MKRIKHYFKRLWAALRNLDLPEPEGVSLYKDGIRWTFRDESLPLTIGRYGGRGDFWVSGEVSLSSIK